MYNWPTIQLYKPTIDTSTDPVTYTPKGLFIDNLVYEMYKYGHTLNAFGGYWSSTFGAKIKRSSISRWVDFLNYHVEVYDYRLRKVFEGFVNEIEVKIGPLTYMFGPVTSIANKVLIVYSTVDTSTNPPTMGVRARTAFAEDAESQSKYGVIIKYLSSGGVTAVNAVDLRDSYILEYADAQKKQDVSFGVSSDSEVTIRCLGYIHKFKDYIFNQTANTGTQNLNLQIQEIIEAQPNTIFDESHDEIVENTTAVKRYENDDRVAFEYIKDLVS